MNMMSKTGSLAFAVAGLAAPLAFAQDTSESKRPAALQGMQEMMKDMQGDGGIGMMGMMSQMNEMMGTCNKMMQAMMPESAEKQPDKG